MQDAAHDSIIIIITRPLAPDQYNDIRQVSIGTIFYTENKKERKVSDTKENNHKFNLNLSLRLSPQR